MKKNLFALFFGALFGIGLGLSKMTDPQVVLGFFDISSQFNPLLLVVFISALATTLVGYRFVFKRSQPLIDTEFHLPEFTAIDKRLIFGSLVFGIGWGLSGYCPAPVLGILLFNPVEFMVFVLPMILAFYFLKCIKY